MTAQQKRTARVVGFGGLFFRSPNPDKLLAWYDTNPVRPESRLNEVRSFVKAKRP